MKFMQSSTVLHKQSLQNQWGVTTQIDILFTLNLQMVVIIKKGENVNHAGFDDAKRI